MKKYSHKIVPLVLLSLMTPVISFAALAGVKDFLTQVKGLVALLIPITAGLAVVYFFWGTAEFILDAADEKKRDAGKQRMIWGVVALFVIFSISGIIAFMGSTLGITPSASGNGCVDGLNAGGTQEGC